MGWKISVVCDFARLADRLSDGCPAADIRHTAEPVDYDHPLFYVFLGLVLAVAVVLYLFFTRPLSGYYGN